MNLGILPGFPLRIPTGTSVGFALEISNVIHSRISAEILLEIYPRLLSKVPTFLPK